MKSPCIKTCKIAPGTNLCVGCFRRVEEITGWSKLSDEQRATIMHDLNIRKTEFLLRKVLDWHEKNMDENTLADIVADIRTYLEKMDEERQTDSAGTSSQTPRCSNPFCKGYSI
jgi:predicted Fe-S protein YdhL (DUF1289 family)